MAYCILKSYKLKLSPLEIFWRLKDERNCFFLDSSLNPAISTAQKCAARKRGVNHRSALGRYSILGFAPFHIFKTKGKEPFAKLRELFEVYKTVLPKSALPFLGGAVGFLSYDLGFQLERTLKLKTKDDLNIPDSFFAFYNSAVIIDHLKKTFYVFCVGLPEKKNNLSRALCETNFRRIERLLSGIKPGGENNHRYSPVDLKSNFSKEAYLSAVKKAKEYIRRGDIYQVNLAQRFQARVNVSGFEIFQRLREASPAYFGAYLDAGDFQILSSSPERFLSFSDGLVNTRPMKGTRRRGKQRKEDLRLKKELLKSAKDKAELMMIVDLERNDLGRVCAYDSIKVNSLRELERYSTVYQTTAAISGRLHKTKDRLDLLRACFPGGSITGCPKIRAMEVIEELEPSRRNIYTGALGYLSFCGKMDFNILIRTILKKGEQVYFSAGGGIVSDSDPEKEYEETLIKAKGMMRALG